MALLVVWVVLQGRGYLSQLTLWLVAMEKFTSLLFLLLLLETESETASLLGPSWLLQWSPKAKAPTLKQKITGEFPFFLNCCARGYRMVAPEEPRVPPDWTMMKDPCLMDHFMLCPGACWKARGIEMKCEALRSNDTQPTKEHWDFYQGRKAHLPKLSAVPSASLLQVWGGSPRRSRLKHCLSPVLCFLLLNVRVGGTGLGPSGEEIHRLEPGTWLEGRICVHQELHGPLCSCVFNLDWPPSLPPQKTSLLMTVECPTPF